MSRFARIGRVPPDFGVIEPTLNALEAEMKREMTSNVQGKKRGEALWPIHQIDWQRTRYVHDMYYKYKRIDKATFDYCVVNKLINGPLSAKWLENGYEKLCSLHAIDSRNFNFGGVSICRIPRDKAAGDGPVASVFNGCLGCGSGEFGVDNIFGNKYGQRLAEIQIKREENRVQEEEEEEKRRQQEEEDAAAAKRATKKHKKSKKKRESDAPENDDKRAKTEEGEVL